MYSKFLDSLDTLINKAVRELEVHKKILFCHDKKRDLLVNDQFS